jgi:capsular polysaccharide transport system permease protein
MLILMTLWTVLGRATPYGNSPLLFFATGLIPFMSWNYMSRFTMLALVVNRPLVSLPVVKVLDVVVARGVLELLCSCLLSVIMLVGLWTLGVDVVPQNLVEAAYALGASLLLGFGFGIINGIIAMGFVQWATGYSLIIILAWLTSGVFLIPNSMPTALREVVAFNPVLHGVEWMRTAYYDGYISSVLDKEYLLTFGFGSLALGLVLERFIRGWITKGG